MKIQKKIIISGASGFVGTALTSYLKGKGHEVLSLVRRSPKVASEISWNPLNREIDSSKLEGAFAVINLSGESISSHRWTEKRKVTLRDSRINTTRFLIESLQKLQTKPKVFISASGMGYYGETGVEEVTESAPMGSGFLAELASKWENEALKGRESFRVVLLRISMVISKNGGALAKMLLPFKLGLGAKLGSGTQYMNWIHLFDLLQCIEFCIENDSCSGPVNACAPNSVTNAEFTRRLANAVHRPTFFLSLPEVFLGILLGEMSQELLLVSTKGVPKKLIEAGFKFKYASIEKAFEAEFLKS
ncbi:MAG: TIGR01777 family oxidoreductase [bacterium]|nr:TIGR01777 family oxidoreductase [bacterium]